MKSDLRRSWADRKRGGAGADRKSSLAKASHGREHGGANARRGVIALSRLSLRMPGAL